MRGQGDDSPGNGGHHLRFGREVRGGAVGEIGSDGNADEGVQGVPDEIEGRNFVGKELDDKQDERGGNDRPGFDHVERGRKVKHVRPRQQAHGGNRGIDIQAGCKTGSGNQAGELFRGKHRDP